MVQRYKINLKIKSFFAFISIVGAISLPELAQFRSVICHETLRYGNGNESFATGTGTLTGTKTKNN